jgi:hypothetical protein
MAREPARAAARTRRDASTARGRSTAAARRGVAAAALAGAVTCSTAIGQDEGSLIIGEQEKLVPFGLLDWGIAFQAFGRYQTDAVGTDGSTVRESEWLFREELILDADGYAGHPNLLDLDLNFRLRFEQEDFESDVPGASLRSFDTTFDYDVAGTFLQQSKLPVTLYSVRNQALVSRQFGSTLDSVLFEYGGWAAYQSEVIPTRIQIFHRDQDQSGRGTVGDFNVDQNTVTGNGQILPMPGQAFTWNYTFDSVRQSGSAFVPNDFDRHLGFATYDFSFGPQRRNHLLATLQIDDVSGSFGFQRFRAEGDLRMYPTRDLDTWLDYRFDRRAQNDVVQTSQTGSALLRHRLFKSLVTSAEFGISHLDIDDVSDFTSDQVFGELIFDYTNRVPYGRVYAQLNLRYSHEDASDRGSPIQITDEPGAFGASGVIVLNRRNIIAGSIVVTDITGIITYALGADYTVQTFPDRTELTRVLGGAIGVNQPLLIDYQIGPEPGGTTDTGGLGTAVRYSINEGLLRGLSFYGNYFDQNETRRSDGGLTLPENDIQDLRVGVDYNIWHLAATAEYQDRRSSLSPFRGYRIEARWVERLGPGSSLTLSTLYQDVDRVNEATRSRLLAVNGQWFQQLTSQLRLGLALTYRDEQNTGGTSSRGFDQYLDLTWTYRQTQVYATLRNSLVDGTGGDTSSQSFLVGFRREF